MKKIFLLLLALCNISIPMQAQNTKIKDKLTRKNLEFADKQLHFLLKEIDATHAAGNTTPEEFPMPRNIEADGSLRLVKARDWTSGFFPGVLWYMYEMKNDDFWKKEATKYTAYLEKMKTYKGTHDLGFVMYCSYGNGLRLANIPGYKEILLETARSLITRYDPKVGCIRSWDHNSDKWQYPVIIDNMMNLELLFWASRVSGDHTFKEIAVSHADNTMKNHFRADYSSYHVVDYNVKGDGKAIQFHTHQGYAHESAWARGQAWGLYGYVLCYRETGDIKYLNQAEHIAHFILTNKNMPKDLVPYWDFNAPNIPNEPRDVSAAAITASALYELSTVSKDKGAYYKANADKIMTSISEKYRSKLYDMHGFLTTSSTGHLPHNSEINVPIIYADYYFVEALVRKERLAKGRPVVPPLK